VNNPKLEIQTILGLDPGRDKCGVAVMRDKQEVIYHQVIDSASAIAIIGQLSQQYDLDLIVMGDGTTSKSAIGQCILPKDYSVYFPKVYGFHLAP